PVPRMARRPPSPRRPGRPTSCGTGTRSRSTAARPIRSADDDPQWTVSGGGYAPVERHPRRRADRGRGRHRVPDRRAPRHVRQQQGQQQKEEVTVYSTLSDLLDSLAAGRGWRLEPMGKSAESLSGSPFERAFIDETPYVVKHIGRDLDWIMRVLGDGEG